MTNGGARNDDEPAGHANPKKNSNGLLQTIFGSGDTTVKVITMALIVVSGGGNFFATNNLSQQEQERARDEIHELHRAFEGALQRQKDMQNTLDQINRKLNTR